MFIKHLAQPLEPSRDSKMVVIIFIFIYSQVYRFPVRKY